jgi:transcriptional regulator with XRE-family HTH domain
LKAEQIKAWRLKRDLSQNDLAELLNVDVMTISRWERGERTAPAFLALALEGLNLKETLGELLRDYQQAYTDLTDGQYEFKSPAITRARAVLKVKGSNRK